MERAYSLLTIRSADNDARVIEGTATTPSADRYGDIVVSTGAVFKCPLALLWQHRHDQPIGQVEFAQVTETGIPFSATIARVDEPGTLKDRLDEAWQSIRAGLVRGISIGFRPLEYSMMDNGGIRYLSWEWVELSAVTVPANAEATINVIRSIDTTTRAALGIGGGHVVHLKQSPARVGATPFVIRTIYRSQDHEADNRGADRGV
ncbi:HK97 family phage prohead protease [Paraburkholderia sp. WSM4175]|uniref:HK97 family phage prohead protease n=1 Tax=Paraburkholderia sp. WSM4175 TaxID=2991072 RepID=UPI003D2606DE